MDDIVKALRSAPADARSLPPRVDGLSDADLVRAVAAAIARPKAERSTSFTLHAPMELLARAMLLSRTPPEHRGSVRLRIASIASLYAEGEELAPRSRSFVNEEQALDALTAALVDADADLADAAISFLIDRLSVDAIRTALADAAAPCLGAAAHAPILFAMFPAGFPAFGNVSRLLRAPLRALAAEGRSRLTWLDGGDEELDGPSTLFEALAGPPSVVSPSVFIAPTMLAVEAGGFAKRRLGRATRTLRPDEAQRQLARIAALSMLQDDADHAPYGWTHALTLAQGAIALARHTRDPRRGVRAAATYVLGFRSTLGKRTIVDDFDPKTEEPDETALAARAASHRDAHLAKYTLACFWAAEADPPARGLFLAAAARLGDWWAANPDAGDEI